MSTLIAPKLLSSRHQARELTASLAEDLSGTVVLVDCSALQATTPSFVDELVKAVLVDRGGERLVLRGRPSGRWSWAGGRRRTGEWSTAWRPASGARGSGPQGVQELLLEPAEVAQEAQGG